jgi:shikimate dehydrogenase
MIYRRKPITMIEITGKTRLTGLIGTPVAHSISPQMHNEAFRTLGLDYVYLAFDVSREHLADAVRGLKEIGIRGFNVTMPHKQAVAKLADELTPAAQIAGACNTVINEDGRLIGHTTDGIGFMDAVRDAGYEITGKRMTILGCGGASTAICAQAALDGVSSIAIFEQPAEPFASHARTFASRVMEHTACEVTVHDITDPKDLRSCIAASDLLTNATNVGMAPDTEGCLIPDSSFLRPGLIVCDIIYNPQHTKLYQMAESAGCSVFNGMYMLLFQGAASFQCWTGRQMPIEHIRAKYFTV